MLDQLVTAFASYKNFYPGVIPGTISPLWFLGFMESRRRREGSYLSACVKACKSQAL